MPASFPFAPGLASADFLVEHDNGLRRVKPLVAFLCAGEIEFVERLNRCVICANQSFCFKRVPHA